MDQKSGTGKTVAHRDLRITRRVSHRKHINLRINYMKVIIVDGGASCAARLRRLDENAEIIMVEKGP